MKKWTAVMLLIVILLFGSVIGFNFYKQKKIADYLTHRPIPEFPVTALKVSDSTWTSGIHSIGFIESNQGVDLAAAQAGKVISINFKSGQAVAKGQLLIELDQAIEKANLKTAEEKLPYLKSTYQREKNLVAKGNISKENFDKAHSEYLQLITQIESLKASIDQFNITAPFSGKLGIRNVYLGQYLKPGDQISLLEDMSQMRIRFTIPQTEIAKINIGQTVNIMVDAFPEKTFSGKITAIDSVVDPLSGVIELQASIPNNNGELRSGMFAKVVVVLPAEENQIVIPQTAVTFTLYGESVYLIEEVKDNTGQSIKKVKQVIVKVSQRLSDKAKISTGVKSGDTIVTSGQIHLSNGSRVKVVQSNTLDPNSQLPKL